MSGKEYKGFVIYGSDETWPRLKEGEVRSERINYLAFFPYINKPAMLVDLGRIGPAGLLYHIFVIPGCAFLFLLVNGRKKSTMGCGFILMLLFPIGFLLAGLLMDDMPLNEAIIKNQCLGRADSVLQERCEEECLWIS